MLRASLGIIVILSAVVTIALTIGKEPRPQRGVLEVRFWEEKAFYDGLPKERIKNPKIAGGIIPHHLIAGTIIGDFYNKVQNQKPKTIILIGPNHYENGNAHVISSDKDWSTAFGKVQIDEKIIQELVDKKIVSLNDPVMLEEHSLQGSIPYIAYFTPQSNIVPLMLSNDISEKEMYELVDVLEPYVKKGAFVIASVDFSHHLQNELADRRDVVTLDMMKRKDYKSILSLNSEYIDSPVSIALIMLLMERTGHGVFTLDHHTNSGKMLGDLSKEVTSYISGTFR